MPSARFIILRAKPYLENDLIVDVLSREGERRTFLAKNALKSKRRFAGGVLEPLHYVELDYLERKTGFDLVKEGQVLNAFDGLRKNYDKIQMALYFLKLAAMATREGLTDNKGLFDLLGNTLRALETAEDHSLLRAQFEIKFLYQLGLYLPADELGDFVKTPIARHGDIKVSSKKLQEILIHTHQQIERVKEL